MSFDNTAITQSQMSSFYHLSSSFINIKKKEEDCTISDTPSTRYCENTRNKLRSSQLQTGWTYKRVSLYEDKSSFLNKDYPKIPVSERRNHYEDYIAQFPISQKRALWKEINEKSQVHSYKSMSSIAWNIDNKELFNKETPLTISNQFTQNNNNLFDYLNIEAFRSELDEIYIPQSVLKITSQKFDLFLRGKYKELKEFDFHVKNSKKQSLELRQRSQLLQKEQDYNRGTKKLKNNHLNQEINLKIDLNQKLSASQYLLKTDEKELIPLNQTFQCKEEQSDKENDYNYEFDIFKLLVEQDEKEIQETIEEEKQTKKKQRKNFCKLSSVQKNTLPLSDLIHDDEDFNDGEDDEDEEEQINTLHPIEFNKSSNFYQNESKQASQKSNSKSKNKIQDSQNKSYQETESSQNQDCNKRSLFNLSKYLMHLILECLNQNHLRDVTGLEKGDKSVIQKIVEKIKQSGQRTAHSQTLYFNHSHYNCLFLFLNKESIHSIKKFPQLLKLHEKIFGKIDLEGDINEIIRINKVKAILIELILRQFDYLKNLVNLQRKQNIQLFLSFNNYLITKLKYFKRVINSLYNLKEGQMLVRF